MKESIRILVVGEPGVGKSSLISTYISRHFPEEVPPVMTDAIIPPEITSSGVSVTIMDSSSSSRTSDRESIVQKIAAADVILALYDITRLETLDALVKTWMPLINSVTLNKPKPVVAVGQKADLIREQESDLQGVELEKLNNLLLQFPNILSCDRCSSLKLSRIDHVFYMAELFVSCPLSPIYDISRGVLTPDCKRAFAHIFRIFDRDGDNLLNDYELSMIQQKCFDALITSAEISEWKVQISNHEKNGVIDSKVTLDGFLCGMKLFIDASMLQTPWAILRSFNYNDDLVLEIPESVQKLPKINADQHYTLSSGAIEFLRQLIVTCQDVIRKNVSGDANSEDSSLYHSAMSSLNDSILPNIWQSDNDKFNWAVLQEALSVLDPAVVHPWKNLPLYQDEEGGEISQSHSLLFPGMSNIGFSQCNIDSWLLHWHMLALYKPALTQSLLYRLGYFDKSPDCGVVPTLRKTDKNYNKKLSSKTSMKAIILGTDSREKKSFFRMIHDSNSAVLAHLNVISGSQSGLSYGSYNSMPSTSIDLNRSENLSLSSAISSIPANLDAFAIQSTACFVERAVDLNVSGISNNSPLSSSMSSVASTSGGGSPLVLVASAVSESLVTPWVELHGQSCDIAFLVVNLVDESSIETAKQMEAMLPVSTPKVYLTVVNASNIDVANLCKSDAYVRVCEYLRSKNLADLFIVQDVVLENLDQMNDSMEIWASFQQQLSAFVNIVENQRQVSEPMSVNSVVSYVSRALVTPNWLSFSIAFAGISGTYMLMKQKYHWISQCEHWLFMQVNELALSSLFSFSRQHKH